MLCRAQEDYTTRVGEEPEAEGINSVTPWYGFRLGNRDGPAYLGISSSQTVHLKIGWYARDEWASDALEILRIAMPQEQSVRDYTRT